MCLYLLFDVSGSMAHSIERRDGTSDKKVNILREKLAAFLGSLDPFGRVCVYPFSSTATELGEFTERADCIREVNDFLLAAPQGCTFVWDCVDSVLGNIPADAHGVVVCITDGEDSGSELSRDEIDQRLKDRPGIDFSIINIGEDGAEPSSGPGESPIETESVESIDAYLTEVARGQARETTDPFRASVYVIPIAECAETDVDLVRSAVLRAVPYLEGLAGLRYYPVPTYIVDDYTFRELKSYPMPGDAEADPLLREDIDEFCRFLEAVSISFHSTCLSRRSSGRNRSIADYSEYAPHEWRGQPVDHLRWAAEGLVACLRSCLDGRLGQSERERVFVPPISEEPNVLPNCEADLKAILEVFRRIAAALPSEVALEERYFADMDSGGIGPHRRREPPDLAAWERRVPNKISKIRACLNPDGTWQKDLERIITVLEIAVPVIFEMIRKLRRANSPYANILAEIHTYGVYLPPSGEGNRKFAGILRKSDLPEWLDQPNTGKVLVCLERIRERVDGYAQTRHGGRSPLGLLNDLVTANVVHEHAHAITFEGVSCLQSEAYFRESKARPSEFEAVSEALAEWAELNFFRESREMFGIVLDHASSGKLTGWPYAGALLMENSVALLGCDHPFRSLLGLFRVDCKRAYGMLRSL